MFPEAEYIIILEEDLEVSVDIFSYFSQLLPIMDEDDTLYCVSAWNDQVSQLAITKLSRVLGLVVIANIHGLL